MNPSVLTFACYKIVKAAWNNDAVQTFVHETVPEAINHAVEVITDSL